MTSNTNKPKLNKLNTNELGRRDRIAAWLCNWILRHLATETYNDFIGGSIRYGMASAARDEQEGREPPFEFLELEQKEEQDATTDSAGGT